MTLIPETRSAAVPALLPALLPASSRNAAELVEQNPDLTPVVPQRLTRLEDLAAAYLQSKSAATRAAYGTDLESWFAWCAVAPGVEDGTAVTGVEPLRAGLHHAGVWVRYLLEVGDPRTGRKLSPATVKRRISAVSGFYDYCRRQHAIAESPFLDVDRPKLDGESETAGLTIDEMSKLTAAAVDDGLRSEALVRLLASCGLRIGETVALDLPDIGYEEGHQLLRIVRKGGRRARTPLPPATAHALERYTAGRTSGPIFVTSSGQRLSRVSAFRIVKRLAREAGIPAADRISPHSLRRYYATVALAKNVPLRNLQLAMGHQDPSTTIVYDRGGLSFERGHPNYVVALAMAEPA